MRRGSSLLGAETINKLKLQDLKKEIRMETLFVLTIGTSIALGCLVLGFSLFVMKPETPRPNRSRRSADADDL
jgi:hypothetical protein